MVNYDFKANHLKIFGSLMAKFVSIQNDVTRETGGLTGD